MAYAEVNISAVENIGLASVARRMKVNNVNFCDKVKLFFANLWRKPVLTISSSTSLTVGATIVGLAIAGLALPGLGWAVSAAIGVGLFFVGVLFLSINVTVADFYTSVLLTPESPHEQPPVQNDLIEVNLQAEPPPVNNNGLVADGAPPAVPDLPNGAAIQEVQSQQQDINVPVSAASGSPLISSSSSSSSSSLSSSTSTMSTSSMSPAPRLVSDRLYRTMRFAPTVNQSNSDPHNTSETNRDDSTPLLGNPVLPSDDVEVRRAMSEEA